MFVRWWWDDVREFERIVIKNVQYKTYNIYHMFYIHIILQYLHVYMIFAAFIQQNLVQRLLNGVQICKILLRRKCWEPWQAKSSRSTFSVGLKDWVSRPHRHVGFRYCYAWFHTYHEYWDEVVDMYKMYMIYTEYIQNIYRMYLILKCFCNVTLPTLSLFLFWCFSYFDQTEKNWRRKFYDTGLS